MDIVAFRLMQGQDLKEEIVSYSEQNRISAGCIITCVGSLSTTTLRFAGNTVATVIPGEMEILSLTGTVGANGVHLHLSIANATGTVTGGHLLAGCIVRTTAEVVLAIVPHLVFRREPDETTGFNELVVSRSGVADKIEKTKQPLPTVSSPNAETLEIDGSASYILHTDGASKGNPGPSGIGIALFRTDDLQNPVAAVGEFIGETTNNVAEYRALIRGPSRKQLLRGVARVEVRTDSQLMAQQVAGKYKVSAPQIIPLHAEAKQLLGRFSAARVVYVPREQNSLADKLANQGVAKGR